MLGFFNTTVADDKDAEKSDKENLCKNDEKACYGIADAGQNVNIVKEPETGRKYGLGEAPPCCPGALSCVPKGTNCSQIIVGQDEKLNYVRGSDKPDFNRPQVKYCYPYNYADKKPMFPNPDWRRKVDRV